MDIIAVAISNCSRDIAHCRESREIDIVHSHADQGAQMYLIQDSCPSPVVNLPSDLDRIQKLVCMLGQGVQCIFVKPCIIFHHHYSKSLLPNEI